MTEPSDGSVRRGGVIERGAKPPIAGVDAERPPGLGVDEGQLADVDERVLARVGDLEGDDGVAAGDLGQRPRPSRAGRGSRRRRRRRRACVRIAADERQRTGGRRLAAALLGRLGGDGAQEAEHPATAAGRRRRRSRGRPRRSRRPSRLPRRAAKRPTTSAAPSATSALRRSAVPKCIDGEWSSRSQAVSCRSGTSSRTCGTSVRAVAFQSIRRTSSPGSYGRMRSSSRPVAVADDRGGRRSSGHRPAGRATARAAGRAGRRSGRARVGPASGRARRCERGRSPDASGRGPSCGRLHRHLEARRRDEGRGPAR